MVDKKAYKIERNWCKENCDDWDQHRQRENGTNKIVSPILDIVMSEIHTDFNLFCYSTFNKKFSTSAK